MSFNIANFTETDNCKLSVKCGFDDEEVTDTRAQMAEVFMKQPIPGFRAGKAPPEVVRLHFKKEIEDITKKQLAQQAFSAVIAEKNIKPFGQPQFTLMQLSKSNFYCEFCLNKIPDIELVEYKGLNIPRGNLPNAVEMAERTLQELRERYGTVVPFAENDFVQTGDTVLVNYAGFLVGNEEPSIKMDGEVFVIGKADLEAFNENLLGMQVGDKREFITTMPHDTTAQHIADREVKFMVELSMAHKPAPAPLDDELAVKVGVKDLNELVSLVQSAANVRIKELERKNITQQISARLVEKHKLDMPNWLATTEAQMLARQYGYNWQSLNDEHRLNLINAATKNIKLSLILNKIREVEPEAQLADEEIGQIIRTNISKYKNSLLGMKDKSDEEVLSTIESSGLLPALITHIKDDAVIDFIIKNSTIED